MQLTRRDLLKDLVFAAALFGLPEWMTQLDEPMAMERMSFASSQYPWPWEAPHGNIPSPELTALSRVAFGPRPGDVERVQSMGVDVFIEEQLHPESIDDSSLEQQLDEHCPTLHMGAGELAAEYPPVVPGAKESPQQRIEELLAQLGLSRELPGPAEVVAQLQEATLLRAIYSRRQLFETLVDFWSNHLNIFILKNQDRWLKTVDDREVIRRYALGNFHDLLLASATSPAMLEYLDNRQNVKGIPNENYAREVMELHTLGVDGGYTQKDVQELARCLTGWTIRPPIKASTGVPDYTDAGTFLFVPKLHDDESKQVLGVDLPASGGLQDGLRCIDLLAHHPSTAHFVSKKLVTRYVADTPPDALVQRAAQTFSQTGGDIRAVMSTILHSEEFRNSFALKIKRPFELVASAARALDLHVDDARALNMALRAMGQGLFQCQPPNGYPDSGAAWINTNGLLGRWNLVLLMAGNKVPDTSVNLAEAMQGAGVQTIGDAVDFWTSRLLHRPVADADREKLVAAAGSDASSRFDPLRASNLVAMILASPYFQYR